MSSLREQCEFMSNVVRRAILIGMDHEQFVKLAETAWLVLTAEPASAPETRSEPAIRVDGVGNFLEIENVGPGPLIVHGDETVTLQPGDTWPI
jgi:hypothetical protein